MEKSKKYRFSVLVAFLTYFVADTFRIFAERSLDKTAADNFLLILIGIAAGNIYYAINDRVKIKHIAGRALVSFLIVEIFAIIASWLLVA